jgi:hypothetical protein
LYLSVGDQNVQDVMGFTSFGGKKQARKFNVEEMFMLARKTAKEANKVQDTETDLVGPPLPPGFGQEIPSAKTSDTVKTIGLSSESESESDESDNEGEFRQLPITHEATISHGSKPVSAIAIDPSGARMITGGYDYQVCFYDFNSMDESLKSFRTISPCENHHVKSLQFSPSGDSILLAAGNSQAKVLDRDGHQVLECPRGYQYISDMMHTVGHVAMINAASWNPKQKEIFLTCSNDCSLRLWDVNDMKKHFQIMKAKDKQGRKTAVTTCCFSRDGKLVAGAGLDGSIQIWNAKGPLVKPTYHQTSAHVQGSETSCLAFAYDNQTLVSRGGDDTVKLWDIRAIKKPVNVVGNLENVFPMTTCAFSPDDQIIATGTSVKPGEGRSRLVFFNRMLEKVEQIDVHDSSAISCLWHPKLNQVFLGCADGKVRVSYSERYSSRGVKLCVVKSKKKKSIAVGVPDNVQVITPHALPLFQEDKPRSLKRQREKNRADPLLSRKPEAPIGKRGTGGRLGVGSSFGAYLRKVAALEKVENMDDPREAVLKYAKIAEEDPYFVAPAYNQTQPKAVFSEVNDEDEDD